MPIPELDKFREKYPQYNDLSDNDIANKLATKYPDAYGDLPQKVSLEEPQQILPEQITQSPDVQLMANWLRNIPFGKRISSIASGQPLENIERTLSAIPEPESKTFGMAVGKIGRASCRERV